MGAIQCNKCGMELPEVVVGRAQEAKTREETGGEHVCPLCAPPAGVKGRQSIWIILLKLFLIVAFVLPGFFLQRCSYTRISELRQIARVPRTKVMAAVAGEVNLSGKALQSAAGGTLLKATDTQTSCLYFRYTKEREERNSDGKTKWVVIDRDERYVSFDLADGSGRARIEPCSRVKFHVPRSHRRQSGNYRFTEYRIDPGERVFVFGFLEETDNSGGLPVVSFLRGGDYQPIISKRSELEERQNRGLGSIWLCWGGLCFVGLATAILFSLLGLHRMLVFFGLLSTVVSGLLVYLGTRMMVEDLTTSQRRAVRQEEVVRELIQKELKNHGERWSGTWEILGDFSNYAKIPAPARTRLRRIRIDQASTARRVRRQATSFPYSFIRPWVNGALPSEIPLTERDEKFLEKIDAQFVEASVSGFGGMLGSVLGLGVGLGALLLGFRSVAQKRLAENLPTTPTSGVTYGLTEVMGLVVASEDDADEEGDEAFLRAPLSGKPCVAYEYQIKEKRRSGKRTRWVTIHSDSKRRRFQCVDREGALFVDPEGAEIDPWRKDSRREGKLKHEETRIEIGDPVYILAQAQVDPEQVDTLYLAKPVDYEEKIPFLISGFRESHVLWKKGRQAALVLTAAFGGFLFFRSHAVWNTGLV